MYLDMYLRPYRRACPRLRVPDPRLGNNQDGNPGGIRTTLRPLPKESPRRQRTSGEVPQGKTLTMGSSSVLAHGSADGHRVWRLRRRSGARASTGTPGPCRKLLVKPMYDFATAEYLPDELRPEQIGHHRGSLRDFLRRHHTVVDRVGAAGVAGVRELSPHLFRLIAQSRTMRIAWGLPVLARWADSRAGRPAVFGLG